MQIILRQIYRARRRWIVALGFQFFAYSLCATFSIAVLCLLVPKLVMISSILSISTNQMALIVIATAGLIGSLSAIGMTCWYRPTVNQAAIEVDLRLKLKERLSSVLAIRGDQDSGLAQALVADAVKTAERIDVRDAFPLVLNPKTWLMFIPVFLAIAMLWIPNATATASSSGQTSTLTQTEVENATKPLMALVQKAKEDAEEDGLEESAEFFKKLEKQLDDLKRPSQQDSKKLLTDLNALKQEMEKRREQLGSSESLKKNLASMKELTDGPAEKMADAMKEGDFEEASESIEKMMEDIEKGAFAPGDIEKLSKQLDTLAKALEQAAAEHEQTKQDIEKKIAQAEQAGDIQKAAELRKELSDKKAEDSQIAEMSKNASQSKALGKMLQEAKDAKAKACSGECDSDGGKGKGNKDGKPKWKRGGGEGAGGGPRDEEETDTKFIDSQVRTEIEEGETIYGGKVGGKNRKGTTREEVQQAIRTSEIEDEQALETIVLPKRQRDQTRDYFDSLRK